ncbi:MAG: hypothetical protein AAB547_00310 [Patescibacteria group bacterium]
MSAEQSFNPATHRKEYGKTEKEVARVKSEITGDKSAEKIAELVAERERLMADLDAQKGAAKDQGNEDDKNFDDARIRIQEPTEEIGAYKERITEITGKDTDKDTDQEQKQPDIESLQQFNKVFLSETFESWYHKADAKKAKQKASFEKPETLDYAALVQDVNEQKFGEYTLNPDTQTLDFEKAKVFIPDLSSFVGKSRHEVMQHIVDTYGATHHIPGIEYWKWAVENFNQAKQAIKDDGHWYFCPGSLLRDKDGHWYVSYVYRAGSRFARTAYWFLDGWGLCERVVLLEK